MEKKDTILYVDDEQDNLLVFQSAFRREYNVITCDSAKKGFEVLNKEDVKVVISDQRMPEMTGLDFLKITSEKYPAAVRIILTAYTDVNVIIDAINMGSIYRFITKPWKREELQQSIKSAIDLYNLQFENKKLVIKLQETNALLEEAVLARTQYLMDEIATKNKITSILAHDIKNSFNAVLMATTYMKKNISKMPDEQVMRYIKDMNYTTRKSNELLETILAWSISDLDHVDCTPEELVLFDMVKDNIEFLWNSAEKKNLSLIQDVHEDEKVVCDKNMLNVILRNIIGNAIKFTPQGGSVKIFSSTKGNEHIEIFIEDNGVGMDQETLLSIFDVNQLASKNGTNGEKGTGLGLVMCKDFAEKNNGIITVSSKPGKGSVFKIVLPVKK